ncbi:MAG: pyruvate dehydrogenase (acetyl-transferring) E1 component subunit alpha [Verrucomicrobiota bacterium]|nr:pyruvate dehydrogenase (acetyl-transferring) E1 component subunit alpha [Verrucomicrobiota bacterium]
MASKTQSKTTAEFADDPINASLTADDKIELLRKMVRIRRFEQTSLKHYHAGSIGGFLHLYIGQESVAVGSISLLGDHDHVITAYRDHGHALAVGMTMDECMAEVFGKKTGCSKGKGGSMHYFAPDKNYWGGHGIVGGQTPLGAGLAFGVKYLGQKGCCLCYLGDGAINQGAFHEALNLAALWDLPVIFIIENNGYSMGTSQVRSSAHPEEGLAARAQGYNMDWAQIDGVSVYEIRAGVNKAVLRAHEESRPTLLEIKTYRHKGHSVADANAEKYRTKEEIQEHMAEHDPIDFWKSTLIGEGVITEDDYKRINKEAGAEADAAAEFAIKSPFPDESEIFDDIYWEVDNNTEAGRTGRHFFHG